MVVAAFIAMVAAVVLSLVSPWAGIAAGVVAVVLLLLSALRLGRRAATPRT
jgi:uncharacterized oligopeptide transporter (OPT) family protein